MFAQCASSAVNCGYTSVAIRELTSCKRAVNKGERQEEFQKLFGLPTYSIPINYYHEPSKNRPSAFNKHADAVVDRFARKWDPSEASGNQLLFPVKPAFVPETPSVSISLNHTERENAKRILSESNRLWEQNYGRKSCLMHFQSFVQIQI